jgi:hypothetical protein
MGEGGCLCVRVRVRVRVCRVHLPAAREQVLLEQTVHAGECRCCSYIDRGDIALSVSWLPQRHRRHQSIQ